MDIIEILFTASFWAAAIRIASPLIFATLGELICERAGVLNLGIEGIMVAGAFAGWMAVYSGTGLWAGVGVAMIVGMLFGLLHSTLTVPFGLSQHVVGLGVTLLATSSTYFAYRVALPEVTSPPKIAAFQPYEIPLLSDIPLLANASDISGLCTGGCCRRCALPNAAWPCCAGGGGKPVSGCGAGAVCCRGAHGSGDRWQRVDGRWRRVFNHVGL